MPKEISENTTKQKAMKNHHKTVKERKGRKISETREETYDRSPI